MKFCYNQLNVLWSSSQFLYNDTSDVHYALANLHSYANESNTSLSQPDQKDLLLAKQEEEQQAILKEDDLVDDDDDW